MKIQNKKTKLEYLVNLQTWEDMKDKDGTNLQKLYTITDNTDLTVKQEIIPINKDIVPETLQIEVEREPLESAIEGDNFDSTPYTLGEIENFLIDKDLELYIDKLVNDPRVGMKKILK